MERPPFIVDPKVLRAGTACVPAGARESAQSCVAGVFIGNIDSVDMGISRIGAARRL
jgi:hypothetical protein